MLQPLTARVTPDGAMSFDATIANLTPSSLFLRAPGKMRFRQSVSIELGELTLYGEVAFVCHEPPGAVVVFRASAEDLHTLEDHMEEVVVVEGGETWTALSDEDPTNPAGRILDPTVFAPRATAHLHTRASAAADAETKLATVLAPVSQYAPTEGERAGDPNDVPTVDGIRPDEDAEMLASEDLEGDSKSEVASDSSETDHPAPPAAPAEPVAADPGSEPAAQPESGPKTDSGH